MCAIHVLDYDEEGNVTKSTDYALANPKIVSYTPKQSYLKTGEACLSVPEDVKVMFHVMLKSLLKDLTYLQTKM